MSKLRIIVYAVTLGIVAALLPSALDALWPPAAVPAPAMARAVTAPVVPAPPPLRPLPAVFQQPQRYARMSIAKAAKLTRSTPNQVKNIVIKTPQANILFETKDRQTVSYVGIELKETAPCSYKKPFDDAPIFQAVGLDPSTFELARKATHAHTYYDHVHRLKITVICSYDGDGPLSIGFSAFWYENR